MKKLLLLAFILSASFITVNAQVGDLDSTFGTNGLVRTDFGMNIPASSGRDVLLHPDGSFYVYFEATRRDGVVTHYTSNGTLDLSYGEFGYSVAIPITGSGSSGLKSRAVIQPDGKIVIGGFTIINGMEALMIVRLTTNGSLDNSFSEDGKQVTDFLPGSYHVTALELQSDGKILAGGNGVMARYHPDGSLDSSFSGDGKLTGVRSITDMVIQSDGKIVICSGSVAVTRYLSDGSLDSGFGSGGTALFEVIHFSVAKTIIAVAIQNDGKIVVGGHLNGPGVPQDFMVGRLNSNGSIDNSFSGDGVQITNFGGSSFGEVVTLQNNGKIILAGRYNPIGTIVPDIALARYNTDGSLDSSFSGDGKLTSRIGEADVDFATSIALQTDSKILVAGYSSALVDDNRYFFVERFDTNGNLDSSLDGDGLLLGARPGDGTTHYYASAVQADGKIIAAGATVTLDSIYHLFAFAIARYHKDGSLDNSFSEDGRQSLVYAIPTHSAIFNSVKIQTDGKIVAAGQIFNVSNYDFAIARFKEDGTLDSSFSDDGILFTDFNGEDDMIYSMAIQSDGKIVVAGSTFSATNLNFALARYNVDGTFDNSFSDDGKLVIDLGASSDIARSVLIQPDGKIVAVGDSRSGLALIRLNLDGSLDPLFDGDGILVTDLAFNSESANAAALQKDGKIVAAGNITPQVPGDIEGFLIVRYNSDGTLDSSFSGDGVLIFDFGTNHDIAYSIALQMDEKLLVGGRVNLPPAADLGLIRLNRDGTLDSSFSDDGIVIKDFENGWDEVHSLSISDDRVYAVGFTSYGLRSEYGAAAAFRIFDKPTSPLIVNIPDTFAIPKGVEINTVYKGYEPASKLTLVAETSGGTAPYTYKWSNGATTASITVGPFSTKTYSVIVTDANGTTASASIMIKVVDVRCGYKLEKVLICHKGHEGSHRSVTLCISPDAVESHLRHGDNLGSCRQFDESNFLTISAHPNPSRHSFDLRIKSNETVVAELIVWNILGKIIERKTVYTNSTVRIGAWYRPGIYLAEVKYKNKRARTKLIKLSH